MKRTFIAALLAGAALSAQAEQKLRVIDLGGPNSPTQSVQPVNTVSVATAAEAADFMSRLDSAVERGNDQILSGQIDPVQRRKQAQALAALQAEGEKFGVLFTPFHKCNEAAISAASTWQGLIGGNARQFENGFNDYEKDREACLQAAG
ncbi:hypothetical protein GHO35_26055 [Pseudomonas helleri]|uniref:hypothetical protein n=1 Tax=Pseudomonas helleri TaxID=1608996 RepID=UPI001297E56F|nr:hypothetical protein [Pseudomonas helleri]MQU24568.1 hypothetical protein [Pseudomonas helleri]